MIEKIGDKYRIEVAATVPAPIDEAWELFLDPKKSAEIFFGVSFESDLKLGSAITWAGEWEGKPFKDVGKILDIKKPELFRYDYFSNFSGQPDLPDNHYEVTYSFAEAPGGTRIAISQAYAKTKESAEHSERNWTAMLEAAKAKLGPK